MVSGRFPEWLQKAYSMFSAVVTHTVCCMYVGMYVTASPKDRIFLCLTKSKIDASSEIIGRGDVLGLKVNQRAQTKDVHTVNQNLI